MAATPAIRAAEAAGIRFSLHEYEHDPRRPRTATRRPRSSTSTRAALQDARRLRRRRARVACVPVSAQLDLKRLGKRASLADKTQAQSATGYVSGGTSPLGQRKRLPTHIDSSALEHETILVNGGRRGLQLELDPRDLARLTDAPSTR